MGSGKYQRTQFSPSIQNNRIIRLERVENREKLRFCRPLVPLLILTKQLKQMINSTLRITIRIKRLRQLKARLLVLRVCFNRGGKLCHGACVGCLSGKLKLRMGRFEFG